MRIIITPPWWRSHLAFACYILIFLAILLGWRQFELRRSRLKNELKMRRFESQKLQEIDSMKSRFFANISHEFRTLLTLILGPISNMLDLSKIEAGKMTLQAKPENIVALLNHIVQSFESQEKLKGIELKFHSQQDEIIAYVDRDKIENIFYNLLSNALKFTLAGGTVESKIMIVESMTREMPESLILKSKIVNLKFELVEIMVKDTGIGIPSDRLDKIFDRFYQATERSVRGSDDSYIRDHEGTGIGLALTKELVDLHHGKIEVQSELNKGTTFRVYLPLGKEHLKPEEIVAEMPAEEFQSTEEPSEGSQPSEGFTPPSHRKAMPIVLIVEDNRDMRCYLKDSLARDYRVIEAVDGQDGFNIVIDKIPALIISIA